jgi:hypothetical protein
VPNPFGRPPGVSPGWPPKREPGARLRLVPNETLLPGPLGRHVGELAQALIDEGADLGVSLEIDTSDRTRPGENRRGASPIDGITLFVVGAAAGVGRRQLSRLADRLCDVMVDWALRHRQAEPPPPPLGVEPIAVTILGPDGEPLRNVLVPQGEGDAPPVER